MSGSPLSTPAKGTWSCTSKMGPASLGGRSVGRQTRQGISLSRRQRERSMDSNNHFRISMASSSLRQTCHLWSSSNLWKAKHEKNRCPSPDAAQEPEHADRGQAVERKQSAAPAHATRDASGPPQKGQALSRLAELHARGKKGWNKRGMSPTRDVPLLRETCPMWVSPADCGGSDTWQFFDGLVSASLSKLRPGTEASP